MFRSNQNAGTQAMLSRLAPYLNYPRFKREALEAGVSQFSEHCALTLVAASYTLSLGVDFRGSHGMLIF